MLITVNDYRRLIGLINFQSLRSKVPGIQEQLYDALMKAKMLPPENISSSVVTMDSRVLVRDIASGTVTEVTVAYPDHSADRKNAVSVFSEFGIALLGQQAGDAVSWKSRDGNRQFEIIKLHISLRH